MAILDTERDAFVVRIVYDGPPFSGKTTTLHALSRGMVNEVQTPGEHDGRTLYFDWLDYTAGRFEGRPIRCQVVTVPGQKSLGERRRKLLREADAIVFVADTGGFGMELSLKYIRALRNVLDKVDEPRPGVVVQANKRDVDDALPLDEVIEVYRAAGVEAAITESVATSGTGIREAFLFGVRLALDRVRELHNRGLLRRGRPDIDSSDDLMKAITEGEDDETAPAMIREVLAEAISSEHADAGEAAEGAASEKSKSHGTLLPDPSVPSGFIWPPVEGRVIAQQALAGREPELESLPCGNYVAHSPNGWVFHSRSGDYFTDQNDGRSALIEWARMHVRNSDLLSERRCIVLSPWDSGWRLWQIYGVTESLRDSLSSKAAKGSAKEIAHHLTDMSIKLLLAGQAFANSTVEIDSSLGTIAADSEKPCYVARMPGFNEEADSAHHTAASSADLLRQQFSASENQVLERQSISDVLSELEKIGQKVPEAKSVADALFEILSAENAA